MRRFLPIWVLCLSHLAGLAQPATHHLINCNNPYDVTASLASVKKGKVTNQIYQLTVTSPGNPAMILTIGDLEALDTREALRSALVKQLKKKELFKACPAKLAGNDKAFDDLIDELIAEKFTKSHVTLIARQVINDNNILKLNQETGNGLYNISNFIKSGAPVAVLIYDGGSFQYQFKWTAFAGNPGEPLRDNFDQLLQLYFTLPPTAVKPVLCLRVVATGYEIVYSYDGYTATASGIILRKDVGDRITGDVNKVMTLDGVGGLLDVKNPHAPKKSKDEPEFKL
jgi:hypothetical protein